MKVTTKVKLRRGTKGRKAISPATDDPEVEKGRIPRVTKLMALAIKFGQMIRDGVVADQAELAKQEGGAFPFCARPLRVH